MTREPSWGDRIREVGEAFLGLVRAEIAAVAADLGKSGRALVSALIWTAVAGATVFWTLGLLIFLLIELLDLVLPRWGAVSIVFGLFALSSLVLVLSVRRRFASIEGPQSTFQRRLDENRRWWQSKIARDDDEEATPPRSGGEE